MELLRKEIRFRGSRRGIKELDIIFGRFIESELENLTEEELSFFKDFLLETDLDLLAYFQNEKPLPAHLNAEFFNRLKGTSCLQAR